MNTIPELKRLVKFKGFLLICEKLFDEFRYEIYRDTDDGELILAGGGPIYACDTPTLDACFERIKGAFNAETQRFEVYPAPTKMDFQNVENPDFTKSDSETGLSERSMSTSKQGLSS